MKLKILYFLLLSQILMSCDAYLIMTYTITNKTNEEVKLFIPNIPLDENYDLPGFGKVIDTTLVLMPNTSILVGANRKMDFPWATKNIYRSKPGLCGIKRIKSDTIIEFGCTKSQWKYHRGISNLNIK